MMAAGDALHLSQAGEREVYVPSTAKTRLAIIDDDTDLRDELVRHFAGSYDVVASLGDPGTLAVLRKSPPAAILLDLDLTTFDGLELLRLVTTDPDLRAVPVVALSANGDFPTFERAHRFGAAEFVTKPFSPDELGTKLADLVSGRTQRADGRLRLGTMLVASGLVTKAQLANALERQRSDGGRLGEVLVRDGLVSEQDIVNAVAGQMRIGVVDLSLVAPSASAIGLLPRDFIIRHRMMPLSITEDGGLVLAMTNPLDVISIDEVSMRTKRRVVTVMCTQTGFDDAIGT
jgi:CheY-like chemotaxis protein